jgi:hypothetical protein
MENGIEVVPTVWLKFDPFVGELLFAPLTSKASPAALAPVDAANVTENDVDVIPVP